MNAQEAFDTVAKHLLTQGQRSTADGTDGCRYRGGEGRKCAAGVLIPDEIYREEMEGFSWRAVCEMHPLVPQTHCHLITELQHLHDTAEPQAWPKLLRRLAYAHNLDHKVVDTTPLHV